ncbi:polyphenol oxidase E, chloroplastic-like [Ipomoea triloba]|uniref:polyphenol oxidase E, chloroplastic-like n=1 Tax=Ipomoea triloba TaxID=35885 RepID=UPI00125D77F0|nr:polyphenol oxidase E, chloroplastic-like [Ipomoea triloba]XP_031097444.1 polyphenol oxidase E, chloroplastic-like [Ipomoea triloba]
MYLRPCELGMDSPILPFSGTITDYKLPTVSRRIVRRPYRVLSDESKEKLETAVRKLKENRVNLAEYDLMRRLHQAQFSPEAHFTSNFAAFHRFYLLMYEKVLQETADDPNLSLPYWEIELESALPEPSGLQFSDVVSGMENLKFSSDVDRWWTVWQTLGGKRAGITDPELQQASFVLYDENNNLVRIKVEDCLDIKKLGYTYEDLPKPRSKKFEPFTGKNPTSSGSNLPTTTAILPVTLNKTVKFYVTRPPTTEDKEAVLNLHVEYDETKNIRFDAYLNEYKDANSLDVEMAEYAGSFINFALPLRGSEQTKTTTWSLEIAQVLQDLALAGENKIPVTLVPKSSGDLVTVKNVDITA